MKNSVISMILVLIFGGLFLCFAQAQKVDLKTVLNLDERQKEAFSKLREESRSINSSIFSDLKTLRGDLLDESAKEIIDTVKINEIVEEIGRQYSILSMNTYENIQKTKEILTKEQFDKFIEHRKNRNNKNFTQKRRQTQQKQ